MDQNKIKNSDYLDIVYDGKNKNYGSYELRKNYNKRLLLGSGIALLILVGVFASTLVKSEEVVEDIDLVNTEEVIMANIEPPDIKPDMPPPPKPPSVPPPPKPTFKLSKPVIEPNKDVKKEEKITDLDKRDESAVAGAKFNDGPDTDPNGSMPGFDFGAGDGPSTPVVVEPEKPKGPERQVDKKAVPPINVESFIAKNANFPEMMRAEGKSGVVTVQFVVGVDGSISQVKALRSPHKLFADEAVRVIKMLQNQGKWTPAEKNGKPVASYHSLPVRFQLK